MPAMTRALLLLWSAAVAGTACDARATPTDPQAAPARAEQKSREYESCGASMHCQDGLRCFDHTCRRTSRSVLGDFQAASAERALAAGKDADAIAAYAEALATYEKEGVPLPVELDCAYGRALGQGKARGGKERAELAARVLHRCLGNTPVGSQLREGALADLAQLTDDGLDPSHLARAEAADVYLSRPPAGPSLDALKVSVSAEPTPTTRAFPAVLARIGDAETRGPLLVCWQAHRTATGAASLVAASTLKVRFVQPYEDEPGKADVRLEPAGTVAPGPAADADACVRAAVDAAVKKVEGLQSSFTTKLTVRIE
jgi:hypothetical protein